MAKKDNSLKKDDKISDTLPSDDLNSLLSVEEGGDEDQNTKYMLGDILTEDDDDLDAYNFKDVLPEIDPSRTIDPNFSFDDEDDDYTYPLDEEERDW
jgi:hypothetical protein